MVIKTFHKGDKEEWFCAKNHILAAFISIHTSEIILHKFVLMTAFLIFKIFFCKKRNYQMFVDVILLKNLNEKKKNFNQ